MNTEQRSAHMAKIRSKNTKPEVRLRSLLHRAGYRFRLHERSLPGRPDLVFTARRKVIFVNGCFWHGHDCSVGSRLPKTNTDFWALKREKNQERDARQLRELESLGWSVLVVWECELPPNSPLDASLMSFLGPPKRGLSEKTPR
ncbi:MULTISPECIES: very short patch repair endonuclease [unclassified Arthrobacter]|uniref:very short patch repair endonuclease n=1 Tax=unclassified Arthrobacter TaxID=235627 RepID=UPI0027D8C532|nr:MULTISPECIES: very short patch repair endonuclease [unclassified Arthrobacter]